jgi:hypothetical protein
MKVRDAAPADVAYVIPRMREADAREVYAARFTPDPQALVDDMIAGLPWRIGFLALAGDDGAPIALLAAGLTTPTVAEVLMVATDDWRKIAFSATRFALRVAIPCYLGPNVRRAECKAWVGNVASRRWLKTLGFAEEGVLAAYGRRGEAFVQCAWVNSRFPNV